jgi:anti-sigma B factor antagonist
VGDERWADIGHTALRLSAHRTRNGTVRLVVGGEIDLATVDAFRCRIVSILQDDGVKRLLIDARSITFLDASGIAALTTALRIADDRRIDLAMVNCQRAVLRVLEITGVDKPLSATGLDQARPAVAS